MKINAGISLLVITLWYQLANIAYIAARGFRAYPDRREDVDLRPTAPKTEITKSKQVVAGLFFQKVFGSSGAVRGLNLLIELSTFGNLVAVLLGQFRVIRECGGTTFTYNLRLG